MTMLSESELRAVEKTWSSDEHIAKMSSNWKTFEKWCDQLGDRADAVRSLTSHLAERINTSPASTRVEYHNAFPGGYLDHSLRVLRTAIDMAGALKVKVPKESLIIAALFHDLGKCGTLEDEYYSPQTSDWHRQRGQFYIRNEKIKLSNAQLGLFMLSQFGVKLSSDEHEAILLNDGMYSEGNKEMAMKECKLSLIVHWADRWSTQCEKSRLSLFDPDAPKF